MGEDRYRMLLPFREEPTMAENSFVTREDVEFAENQCRKKRVPYVLANSVRRPREKKYTPDTEIVPNSSSLSFISVSKPDT